MWKKLRPYVLSIAIALAVGGASALVTNNSMELYKTLMLPPLAPPGWLFPVVWTVLFILMGISAALVWRADTPDRGTALTVYAAQLVVNFFWPVIFFVFEKRLFAFIWLIALLILVIIMISLFKKSSRAAAYLQIPYVLWLLFAGYLNLASYILNG